MVTEEYKSLYDYLGRAAGGELGKRVAEAATRDKVQIQTRQVSNPKYNGTIMTYPASWLESYFSKVENTNKNQLLF
jgi:hypothetical protein